MPRPLPLSSYSLQPYWQTSDGETVNLYHGDVRKILAMMKPQSVHCVVTSPPYWGLRDYGTGTWTGGKKGCKHSTGRRNSDHRGNIGSKNESGNSFRNSSRYVEQGNLSNSRECKCGARRIDNQIGSERIPDCGGRTLEEVKDRIGRVYSRRKVCGECYVCTMVGVFRLVRKVLRNDGSIWLNLGDTYGNYTEKRNGYEEGSSIGDEVYNRRRERNTGNPLAVSNLPVGNVLGIPWKVAIALQNDGWIIRQDIVWAKSNPMPESVLNRCTKAHEYIFLLTKVASDYYFDMEAIKVKGSGKINNATPRKYHGMAGHDTKQGLAEMNGRVLDDANKRSVWVEEDHTALVEWLSINRPDVLREYLNESREKKDVWKVASQSYPGAHFATFPEKLITPCILAGTSEKGCCPICGRGWERVITSSGSNSSNEVIQTNKSTSRVPGLAYNTSGDRVRRLDGKAYTHIRKDTGHWKPARDCRCDREGRELIPAVVLDPFIGSGTTSIVCIDHNRRSIGIELSDKYLNRNAIPRIKGKLLSRPSTVGLIPK